MGMVRLTRSAQVAPGAAAISAAISSLSVVVRKVKPCRSSPAASSPELTRLPLCTTKTRPRSPSAKTGWAFLARDPPVVE